LARDTIGLALSGGGFRASLWALGALLHLEDAGVAGRVTTVSSVSGGSISNGVAAFGGEYGGTDEPIRNSAERLISLAADDGLVLFGPATNRYVRTLLTFAGLVASSLVATILSLAAVLLPGLIDSLPFATRFVSVLIGVSLIIGFALVDWGVAVKARRRDEVFRGIVVLAIVAGVLLAAASVIGWLVFSNRMGVTVLVASLAVSLAITAMLVGQRSVKVERALASELFSKDGKAIRLADLADRRVLHVFCATELQSGIHAYFSPRFVYSFRFGHGHPGPLPLARAVQASAALPGGFRARRIPTAPFRLQRVAPQDEPHAGRNDPMVLLDGGVYDNMGVSWFVGLDQRRRTWASAGRPLDGLADPGNLLVVNASTGWEWRAMTAEGGLLRELGVLGRVQDVMYKTTTRPRRHHLVREWQLLDRCSLPGTRGAIVNIDQSPWELAASVAASEKWGEAAERTIAALEQLRAAGGPSRDHWREIAFANATEPTTLRSLGREVSQRLVWHAYILTAIASHIFLAVPLPSPLPRPNELLNIDTAKPTLNAPTWYQ
jgi:predicted acylesterase/phospholipase RssA